MIRAGRRLCNSAGELRREMIAVKNKNYRLLGGFALMLIGLSTLMRVTLMIFSLKNMDGSFFGMLRIFGMGLLFDIGVASFFLLPYSVYLLLLPSRWSGSLVNRIVTYVFFLYYHPDPDVLLFSRNLLSGWNLRAGSTSSRWIT